VHRSRLIRFTALLAVTLLLAVVIAPTVGLALTAVGGPYSESVSNPDDNGVFVMTPTGGNSKVGASGLLSISVAPGAVLASTPGTATVFHVAGGKKAQDGGSVVAAMYFEPDGLQFQVPNTIYYTYPPGLSNPRAYGWDDANQVWVAVPSTVSGSNVLFNASHFSWYAVGGDLAPTNTPASSDWSLALLAVVGLGVAGVVLGRVRLN
jgi:hypothetical protein